MRVKVLFLKWLDRIIGIPAVFLLSKLPQTKKERAGVSRVLFIRPGGIGDAVLLFPAVQAFKKEIPEVAIHVLAEKRNAGIFEICPEVERIYLYDRGFDLYRILKNKYDLVIDTEQWHRLSAVIVSLTRAPIRIGFGTNEREKLFTSAIKYSHNEYEAESFLRLVEVVIGKKLKFNPDMPFITLPRKKLPPENNSIAIFPHASIKEKRWLRDKFSELSVRLEKKGFKIVAIEEKNNLSLAEIAELLFDSKLLISGDSGMMHIAYGLGTPTLGLFGPGIQKKWAPRGKGNIAINKNLSCSPCSKFGYTPKCKLNAECMSLITVDEVAEMVKELLGLKV